MSTNKVYGLVSSRDNIVRYIGQTIKKVTIRFSEHLYQARRNKDNSAKGQWIRRELLDGYEVFPITIFETAELDKAERLLIETCVANNHELTNTTYNPNIRPPSFIRKDEVKPKPSPLKGKTKFDHDAIYEAWQSKWCSYDSIAKEFGCSKGFVKNVVANRNKSHLTILDKEKNDNNSQSNL